MFIRRQSWAQLIRGGVPPLFVLRPLAGGFTPSNVGDQYPAPDPNDKFQMQRARQMYEQRRIGTAEELARMGVAVKPVAPVQPVRSKKEKSRT